MAIKLAMLCAVVHVLSTSGPVCCECRIEAGPSVRFRRLVNQADSSPPTQALRGQLEVFVNCSWMSVVLQPEPKLSQSLSESRVLEFGVDEAELACHELGFRGGVVDIFATGPVEQPSVGLHCSGPEPFLHHCSFGVAPTVPGPNPGKAFNNRNNK